MNDLQQLQLSQREDSQQSPFFQPPNLFSHPVEFIKIYIGQLPLDFEEPQLRGILQAIAPLKEVKIIKGDNTRGKFDLFCYAFVTMRGNEAFALDVIHRLQQQYPNWKMNVKYDNDRKRVSKVYQPPNMGYPAPGPMPMPYQGYPPLARQPYPNYLPQQSPPSLPSTNPEKVVGQKPCNILVRELWLGGVPEHYDKGYMAQLMAYYGIVEEIEMFPKFAFIKFKQVSEATTAFERAEEISQRLGSPHGFRIFFSDPSRRAYVVSNNYEFEKQGLHVPILFIGFPPITSATVEMEVIKPVVEKFSPVSAEYMRKNTNSQSRSYFLFTFDSVKNAIRVKQELNKRKDLLGDKRAEVTVLLDEEVLMKGRDLSHSQKMFQTDSNHDKHRKSAPHYAIDPNLKPNMMHPPMGYQVYPNHMYQVNPYMPPYYPQQPYYYEQPFFKPEGEPYPPQPSHPEDNIHDILKDVLAGDRDPKNQKKPVRTGQSGREEDILSKLLGGEAREEVREAEKEKGDQRKEEREPSWSGFLTWKGSKRVGVDGYSSKVEPEDYSINIMSLIECKDMVVKDKNVMVLEASNNIGRQTFKEYVKNLGGRVGVAMNSQFLMYVMAKSEESDGIEVIGEEELLMVLEKASTLTLIKDKLLKSEELP